MEREKHTIDATGQSLGRLATKVAILLRGKDRPDFAPHKDNGAFVEVINAEKIKLTGKKEEQKRYYRHTGYMGGLREETVQSKKPEGVIKTAVMGMLPKNKLRPIMIKRLTIKR